MINSQRLLKPVAILLSLFMTLGFLTACAPVLIGGAATTTAVVAVDRRTTGEQVEDKSIQLKGSSEARKILDEEPGRVNVSSYAGRVLLTGDVPSEDDRNKIVEHVSQIDKVVQVIDRLRVGEPTEMGVRSNDTWITTKALSNLINTKGVPTRTMNVTTERGVVYLQGRVTAEEGERAAKVVSGVPGVNEVVKLFEDIRLDDLKEDGSIKEDFAEKSQGKTSEPAPRVEPEAIPVQ
ncbi:MAG TPA: BON domain-containing protein [Paenalcaligenes sp.]|nr:BON domain-containing protein [Paenalcaligenes sp.]